MDERTIARYIGSSELAARLGVSRWTVQRLVRRGVLTPVARGPRGMYLFTPETALNDLQRLKDSVRRKNPRQPVS